ncbi:Protease HtpX [subsurface metagenome]
MKRTGCLKLLQIFRVKVSLSQTFLDAERQQKARQYSKLTRRLLFIELGIGIVLLLALLLSGASAKLAEFLVFPLPLSAALYFLILAFGLGIMMAPLGYYQDFVLPHRFGLSHQKLASWLADRTKALALGLLLAVCLIIAAYWLIEFLPSLWWLAAWVIVLLVSLVLTLLAPTILVSLFFKSEPLPDGELKQRLACLAQRAGIDIKDIFTINLSSKSTTANAMLGGFGKTRRIILSDTMLKEYSTEEIEVALAHELGHHLHHDIARLFCVQAMAFLLAFYLANLALEGGVALFPYQAIGDVAGLPWLLMVLLALFLILRIPLNWYSRRIELAADKAALKLSDNPEGFINLMTKLTDQNLSEAEPVHWERVLFRDHPSYNERVKLAYEYKHVPI